MEVFSDLFNDNIQHVLTALSLIFVNKIPAFAGWYRFLGASRMRLFSYNFFSYFLVLKIVRYIFRSL